MYIIIVKEEFGHSAFGPFESVDDAYSFKAEKLKGKDSTILFLKEPY